MRNRAALVCCWLFDARGENLTVGGSQHYTLQLARMLHEEGWDVRIFQKAQRHFRNEAEGFPVTGIQCAERWWGMNQYSKAVAHQLESDELAIYVFMEAAYPVVHHPSIAVQHGLSWAGDNRRRALFNTYRLQPHVMRHLDAVVCVDTAYINWVHTQLPGRERYAGKLVYIPNFVDLTLYKKQASWAESEEERVVLFPRRLYPHRGSRFLIDALDKLWRGGRRYKAVFCGPGPDSEKVLYRAELLGCSDRVKIYERSFDEMPAEYANSQVAVIPTVAFEGTSLSCIEAMAAGVPVIVTHIGGLGNLVIPGYNGLCVDLQVDALASAIDRVLQDQTLWQHLASNGRSTADVLGLPRWRERWMDTIRQVADKRLAASVEF